MIKTLSLLILTLFIQSGLAGDKELLPDPKFEKSLDVWGVKITEEYKGFVKPAVNDGVFSIKVPNASKGSYLVLYSAAEMENDKVYQLTLEMNLDKTNPIRFATNDREEKSPKKKGKKKKKKEPVKRDDKIVHMGLYKLVKDIEPGWQKHTLTFKAESISSKVTPHVKICLGGMKGNVEIRNCSLVELPEGGSPKAKGEHKSEAL
jgi:hypothetical protein